MPPDRNARAGKKRGGRSGKVADFRYKRAPQPDPRKAGRDGRSNGGAAAAGGHPRAGARSRCHRHPAARPSGRGLCRDRPRHQQLPPADRAPIGPRTSPSSTPSAAWCGWARGWPRPGGCRDEAMDRALGALKICADKLQAPQCPPRPLGRDRGLPPRRERRGLHRAGPARNRHRARHHQRRGRSAAGGAGLPHPARRRATARR